MVCRGAGLHADKARRQSFEELHQLAAAELLSDNDILSRVDAVNLEYVLGDIQSDRGNLHVDGSPDVIRSQRPPYGSSLLGAGAVHHIRSRHPLSGPSPRVAHCPLAGVACRRARELAIERTGQRPAIVPRHIRAERQQRRIGRGLCAAHIERGAGQCLEVAVAPRSVFQS